MQTLSMRHKRYVLAVLLCMAASGILPAQVSDALTAPLEATGDILFPTRSMNELTGTEDNYPIAFGRDQTYTDTDRWLEAVVLNGERVEIASKASTSNPSYVDRLSESLSARSGELAQAEMVWHAVGPWMHAYVYVDWGQDGRYDVEVDADGSLSNAHDLVSYSYLNGYDSAGEQVREGPGTLELPAFRIPEDLKPGFYAMRYKIDWNHAAPEGNADSKDHIINNRGTIVDTRLNIHEDWVTVNLAAENGRVSLIDEVTGEELTTTDDRVAFGQNLILSLEPDAGCELEAITVEHGYFNGEEFIHGIPQRVTTLLTADDVDGDMVVLDGKLVDGEVRITVRFQRTTGVSTPMSSNVRESGIYTLEGRSVNGKHALHPGLYIQNGRKIWVR